MSRGIISRYQVRYFVVDSDKLDLPAHSIQYTDLIYASPKLNPKSYLAVQEDLADAWAVLRSQILIIEIKEMPGIFDSCTTFGCDESIGHLKGCVLV